MDYLPAAFLPAILPYNLPKILLSASHPVQPNLTTQFTTIATLSGSGAYKIYYLNIGNSGTMNVDVSWPGTSDIDVQVYDQSGNVVCSGTSVYNPETTAFYPITTAGQMKVKVYSYSGSDTFTLKVTYPQPDVATH